MTKRRILLKIEIFALIFAVLLSSVTFVMKEKTGILTFHKKQNNNIDVVFCGTSHMMNGVLPLDLYKDYGIAAYNISTSGQPFKASYEVVKDAVLHNHLKLIVIDLLAITWEFGDETEWKKIHPYYHRISDNFCFLSKIKIAHNIASHYNDDFHIFYEIMNPSYLLHSKFLSLIKNDFSYDNFQNGSSLLFSHRECVAPEVVPMKKTKKLLDLREKELFQIIEIAKKNNIGVIFTIFPYDKDYKNRVIDFRNKDINNIEYAQKFYNKVYELISKNEDNISFINYFHCYKEVGFDFSKYMANIDHLNFYGAQKITAHLGKYIKEHYNIPDRRLDPAYAKWNDDYKLYVQDTFAQKLNATRDSEKYVQLIASKKEAADNTCMFAVKTSGGGKNSKYFQTLELNVTGSNYIAVLDSGKVVYQQAASDVPLMHEYKIGKLPVKLVSDVRGTSCIKVDGIEQVKNKSGMTVVIYDKLLKKITSVRSL